MLSFMGAIVAVSLAVAGLIAFVNTTAKPAPAAPRDYSHLSDALAGRAPFKSWLAAWATEDQYLRADEFSLASSAPLAAPLTTRPEAAADRAQPRRGRLVFSPSDRRFADFLAGWGSAYSTVQLAVGDGQVAAYAREEKPGYFQDGFWADDTTFVALGSKVVRRSDGEPSCLKDAGPVAVCYYRLTVDVLDLAARRHDLYVSEKHGFSGDPFAATLRDRWLASLTDSERASNGLRPTGATVVSVGKILTMQDDGLMVMAPSGLDHPEGPVSVSVTDHTVITDENGQTVASAFLRRGLTVNVEAVRNDDPAGPLVALTVQTKEAPAVLVYDPADQATVGGTVTVRGLARGDVGQLTFKLKSRRTGAALAEAKGTLETPAGPWRDFRVALTPQPALRAGDKLVLYVFDPTDLGKGVTLELTAQP